jgi:hypothetical protein
MIYGQIKASQRRSFSRYFVLCANNFNIAQCKRWQCCCRLLIFGPWAEEEALAIVHPSTSCCLAPKQLYGALIDAKFQVEKGKKLNFMAILCANHHKFPAAGFLATSAPLAAQDEGG